MNPIRWLKDRRTKKTPEAIALENMKLLQSINKSLQELKPALDSYKTTIETTLKSMESVLNEASTTVERFNALNSTEIADVLRQMLSVLHSISNNTASISHFSNIPYIWSSIRSIDSNLSSIASKLNSQY
jgi:methyl-accepting chemotaxis protein